MDSSDFENFKRLVTSNEGQTEIQCGQYLHHAAGLLIPQTALDQVFEREDRNFYGSTDFVLAATIKTDQNNEERVAYIWELKAPQCYLFERDDNNNRCRPTKDFIKGENQLIHYVHHAINDHNFRTRFNILHTRNIRAGGIVIGRSSDRMIADQSNPTILRNAHESLNIRTTMLYRSQGIRIFTWDRILEYVRPNI